MSNANPKRIDSAKRIIKAPASSIYQAFLNPESLVLWLPPEGMEGRIDDFQAWEGGTYRMTLTYVGSDQMVGKTSENSDVVQGKFLELSEDKRIVQQIQFVSEDPAFAGKMIMTWNLHAVPEGTEVSIICEDVPEGIRQDEHEEGMSSTLANLAVFLEG
ncbi:SRPBCC domain-containing protein [Brevibacillus humidisoli]|nr:SRPBCC domain-containing protein [Brevibacillus humidisoli]UFJ43326.1 SRPBCC domain-containing protein [Brevibacillus humidisoli]